MNDKTHPREIIPCSKIFYPSQYSKKTAPKGCCFSHEESLLVFKSYLSVLGKVKPVGATKVVLPPSP